MGGRLTETAGEQNFDTFSPVRGNHKSELAGRLSQEEDRCGS